MKDTSYERKVQMGTAVVEKGLSLIRTFLRPEDVFEEAALKDWAVRHGYITVDYVMDSVDTLINELSKGEME